MKLSIFLEEFQDLMQRDDTVALDMKLADMEEWDSLSIMATIAYFDKKFGIRLTFFSFERLQTIADLVALSEGNIG